jgi:SAM-dependent methyltransferase
MSILDKIRSGGEGAGVRAAAAAEPASASRRVSNGLKDFLWLLSDVEHGRILDLGPVTQATVNFFTERGFRVYTEDVLRSWKEFLREEESRLRSAPVGANTGEMEPAALAERFFSASLRHPAETFHAILAWDVFDYLDAEMLARLAQRMFEVLRPGGVVLAAFHAVKPESFHRYRILDRQNVELIPAPALFAPQRVFQNREILNLFGSFRSSKTFVGRDQLREALFTK